MISNNKKAIYYLLLITSLVIFISTFFPWVQILVVKVSAVDLGLGAFNEGKIGLPQIEILFISILPLLVILFLFIEFRLKKDFPYIIYFIIGLILILLIIRHGSISLGPLLAFMGSLSLCIISLTLKRKNK